MKFLCPVLALLLAVLILAPSQSFAEIDKEMQYLHMYFSEDELVVSSSRVLKPLSQVAENMTIVTAEDIENMNAHSLPEVLDYVTGIFLDFQGHDFVGGDTLKIQASEVTHVLVLIDGMPYNLLSDGRALTSFIPVMIIKRIEIIKGPASSAWGSSLGGVINIITKDAGIKDSTSGTLSASYGKNNSQDYRAEASGLAGKAGYYLYAGRQDSDGLRDNRWFENNTFYSKLDIPLVSDSRLIITASYIQPELNYGDITTYKNKTYNIRATSDVDSYFITASYISEISDELEFEASLYLLDYDTRQQTSSLITGELSSEFIAQNEIAGGSTKFIWTPKNHTVVAGIDVKDGNIVQKNIDADVINSSITEWAVFINDTTRFGKLTVTPGVRYDDNNKAGSFISPSLGATYMLAESTLLRASVARGFTAPPATYTSGGGFSTDPNPDLEPENVWSYQAGIESKLIKYLLGRANVFYHEQDDSFVKEAAEGHDKRLYFNGGEVRREGVELELETAPIHNTSLKTGFLYVFINNVEDDETEDRYGANVTLKYDDRRSFMAQLAGSYVEWDSDINTTSKDGMLWDLNLRKRFISASKVSIDVFFTAHNIFDDDRYVGSLRKNPEAWAEAGLRIKF